MNNDRSRKVVANYSNADLESAILELLNSRERGKSICPSEAARLLSSASSNPGWEVLMEPIRRVAQEMAKSGKISITQRGKSVDASKTKGPIRLKLV
jgi:hypothetical protein